MSGTILRGDDGSLYFIRDEVLSACKVEGEYLDRVNKMLGNEESEVEGFSFNLTPVQPAQLQPVGYAQGSLLAGRSAAVKQAGDTIMCPW
jgi:hypothetical protein